MRAKRWFRYRVIETIPWEDGRGFTFAPWVQCSDSGAKETLKVDISKVEEMKSVEVHLLSSPFSRVVIKASEW